jgi:D-arginine dehydrogenase
MERFDVVIVGAGIAGASLAYHLAPHRRVLLLEQEGQPGYHSTGRSAATLHRSYGNATIRALTACSALFYLDPPAGFSAVPPASPRGVLVAARADQLPELEAEIERSRPFVPEVRRLDGAACRELVPLLRPERIVAGMLDPTLLDLDVAAILQGFVRGARARGAALRGDARLEAIERQGAGWRVATREAAFLADLVVNAAGAWADTVAGLAGLASLGIVPKRRTAITVSAPAGVDVRPWPMVADVAEEWYLKPDAGRILCSPADESPCEPGDVQPDELDVAICVERIQENLALEIRRIESRWAGLRTFARDKTPAVGFDPRAEGFFWLAGQGGYGIQTAPAMAALATALLLGEPVPAPLAEAGIEPSVLRPARLLPA